MKEKNTIYITEEVFKKAMEYIEASAPLECSLLCEVSEISKKHVIDKCFLPKQTRSSAQTIIKEGTDALLEEQGATLSKIKCWIHSHPGFSTTPSGPDEGMFKEMQGEDHDLFIKYVGYEQAKQTTT